MSTNNEGGDAPPRPGKYMAAALLQLVNLTHGKMQADLRPYHERVKAAISAPDGDPDKAYQALQDRLKAWHAEFEKKFPRLAREYAQDDDSACLNVVNKILSDISEDFHEITDIRNKAAERSLAAMREQERIEIEEFHRDLVAATTKHQKRVNQMQRNFFWSLPKNRWANRHFKKS